MNITKTIIIFAFALGITHTCYSQNSYTNVVEISVQSGISNMFGSFDRLESNPFTNFDLLTDKSNTRLRSFNTSYTRFFNEKDGIKFILGQASYGFDYKRILPTANLESNSYSVSYSELGLSYIRRIALSNDITFLIEPGILFHINDSPNSTLLFISHKSSFSFSYFSGIEVPISSNNFYLNAGVSTKLPLGSYNDSLPTLPGYSPYFLGLKIGVNYQF